MKYLNNYKFFEAIKNPIQDYIDYFVDDYDFELNIPKSGVCKLTLKDTKYDVSILKTYQSVISELKSKFKLKNYHITFNEFGVDILIERIVEDKEDWEFDTDIQKTAYDSLCKVVNIISSGNSRLLFSEDSPVSGNLISFNMGDNIGFSSNWVSIQSDGRIKYPILRGWKSKTTSDLPFNDSDIKWFTRILQIEDNISDNNSKEWANIHNLSQEKLRKLYK